MVIIFIHNLQNREPCKVTVRYLAEISQLMYMMISAKLHMLMKIQKKHQKYSFIRSICKFQSMKSPVKLNNLLLKFFYVTWLDERQNWRPCKWGLFFKSYCFFEIFHFSRLKTTNYWFKNYFLLLKLLNNLTWSYYFKICY